MKKGVAQFAVVGLLALLAAWAIAQGEVGLAALGWVRASTEAAAPVIHVEHSSSPGMPNASMP